MRRLDYLHGLGVTAIWLMPFQTSPHRDDGYDVADYYSVDPRYGTLGDFVEFTHGAKQRGIRVLIDLVVNHTSDQHPWFKQARPDPDSKYRDWYVWSKKKPKNANEGMVFPGVQKSTWTYDDQAERTTSIASTISSPISTPRIPRCRPRFSRSWDFWIQLGVSGFRMDAVPFIIATKGPKVGKPEEQFDMLRDLSRIPAMAPGRLHHPGRGERAARHRHGVLRRRRRTNAHDVQFPGQPALILCTGLRGYPALDQGDEGDEAETGDGAMGTVSSQSR